MFPNWTGWSSVKIILFVLVAADNGVLTASNLPATVIAVAHVVGTVLGLLGMLVVTLSGSNAGPMLARRAAAVATKTLLAMLFVFGFTLIVTACKAIQSAFPKLDQIEQTIATDLEAGKTDGEIASDVCADLGGNALTDAVCSNVAQIIADVIPVLIDGGYLSPGAKARALAYRTRFLAAQGAR